jgi:hypothetical protein
MLSSLLDARPAVPGITVYPAFRLFTSASTSAPTSIIVTARMAETFFSVWSIDASLTPPTVAQRWSQRDSPILSDFDNQQVSMFSLGDLSNDGLTDALFVRRYGVHPGAQPTAMVLTRSMPGGSTQISLTAAGVPLSFPDQAQFYDVISPFDLDADGTNEAAYVASGFTSGGGGEHHMFVLTGDISRPASVRVLALGAGVRDCLRFGCRLDDALTRIPAPVAGDFDRDGYDDLIAPDLDRSRLMILRGGPRIDDLRWVPLVLPTPLPTNVIGALAS